MKVVPFADAATESKSRQPDELWAEGLARINRQLAQSADIEWLREFRDRAQDEHQGAVPRAA